MSACKGWVNVGAKKMNYTEDKRQTCQSAKCIDPGMRTIKLSIVFEQMFCWLYKWGR